jgi:hypothetical protein
MKKIILAASVFALAGSLSGCLSTPASSGANGMPVAQYNKKTLSHFDILTRKDKGAFAFDVAKLNSNSFYDWAYAIDLVNNYSYNDLKASTKNYAPQILAVYKEWSKEFGDMSMFTQEERNQWRLQAEKEVQTSRYSAPTMQVSDVLNGRKYTSVDNTTKAALIGALSILYNAALDGSGVADREYSLGTISIWSTIGTICQSFLVENPGNPTEVNDKFTSILYTGSTISKMTTAIQNFTNRGVLNGNGPVGNTNNEYNHVYLGKFLPVDPVYEAIIGPRKNGYAQINKFGQNVNQCVSYNRDKVYEAKKIDRAGRIEDPQKIEQIVELLVRKHYKDHAELAACDQSFCGTTTNGYKFVN